MAERLDVQKTGKLYINGGFPRSESGRTLAVKDARGRVVAHIAHASRKDLRNAVEAARAARAGWAGRTAYNRGQILYRMAEMLESRRTELAEAIRTTGAATAAAARHEVDASIDRLVCFAGWADKYAQVLGCANPVAGPYHNFTTPEPTGVVAVIPPDAPPLLGLVSLIAPPLCVGNTIVSITGAKHPLPAVLIGEVCATSDVPPGVINILTGKQVELLEQVAQHRDIDAISAAGLRKQHATTLRQGVAENLKRVHIDAARGDAPFDDERWESPWSIDPFIEMKTLWHPSAT
jgi:acyl-CoA reductase-like NAD-dependent aldehyde dehydrogenase